MYFVDCDHQSGLFQIAQSIRPLFDRAHQGAVLRFLHMAKNRLLRVQNSIESQVGDIFRQCGLAVCISACVISNAVQRTRT